ncbi:MAG: OprO/OprP family phosphate-selective porin [Gammaproteobacteria bacterium]|nr:OprO/OprP family phosphate-selective porin [Gammaproteobacteria bacterium]
MNRLILFGLLFSVLVPLPVCAQQDLNLQWRGFAQLTAERINGVDNTLGFDAERLRARFQLDSGQLTAVTQLDLAVDNLGDSQPGTLANVILDLYASYQFKGKHSVRIGQFKTPLGMDFNLPAHSLDITKRGMDAGLMLNRAIGIMLTGQQIVAGLSYDIGFFNPPSRSGATQYLDSQVGQDVGQVARIRYDRSQWHAEVAHGIAENAAGPGSMEYAVTNLALRFSRAPWTIRAEWTQGRDALSVADRKETVYYLHGAYKLTPTMELVARHYEGHSRIGPAPTDLDNTFIGLTKHFAGQSRLRTRLQVNYVFARGDRDTYTGLRGFREDALLVQLLLDAGS